MKAFDSAANGQAPSAYEQTSEPRAIGQDRMESLLRDNGWRVRLLPQRSPARLILVRVGVRTSRPGRAGRTGDRSLGNSRR
jgi:hypothetical protein